MALNKVKFGVRIHQRDCSYETLRRIWTESDRLGYHSATLYDLLNAPALECWTTLAALAAETERIRLMPLVLANLYRHPSVLAKMASTLDVISRGRLELGIGAGGDPDDHRASGLPFPRTSVRVEMLEEAIEVVKRLWSEHEASFSGSHYSLKEAINEPKPVQKPHPPLLVGGHGEKYLFRAVARYADICNVGFEMSLEEHEQKLWVLEEHCREVGRALSEIEVSHNTRILIGEDTAEFERLVGERAAVSERSADAYRQSLNKAVAGTPEQCAEQIQRYVDGGITYFFLLFPDPIASESLALFAKEVMPHFEPAAFRLDTPQV